MCFKDLCQKKEIPSLGTPSFVSGGLNQCRVLTSQPDCNAHKKTALMLACITLVTQILG